MEGQGRYAQAAGKGRSGEPWNRTSWASEGPLVMLSLRT